MSVPPRPCPASRRACRGFTLVELMVASAVGLLLALSVTVAIVASGRQFTVTGAASAAQTSAQAALSLIDASARNAGSGFYSNGLPICGGWNAWNGTALVSDGATFMPARVVDGGSGSDIVIFSGAAGGGALPAVAVLADAPGAANLRVSDAGGFTVGDQAVVGVPGSAEPCTLFEVTGAPTSTSACGGHAPHCRLLLRVPNTGLNPGPAAFSTVPVFGFESTGATVGPAVVGKVGSAADRFRQEAFGLQCNTLVRWNAFLGPGAAPCKAAPLSFGAGVEALAPGIVLMQAQYGVSSTPASDVVAEWVDARGAWAGYPPPAEVARIKAVRVVLVARSREAENGLVSAPCTNGSGVSNNGPCTFEDAAAPVIDLAAIPTPPGRTWRNYRYRVHAAVFPLRTVIWSE